MNTIYKVTLLFAGTWLATLIARKSSAATRNGLWTASLLSAGVLPLLSMLLPHVRPASSIEFLFTADSVAGSIPGGKGALWPVIWSIGAVAALIPWGLSMRAVWDLRRKSRLIEHFAGIPVLETTGQMSPMVAGWFRPAILLPEMASEWSAELRLNVLTHELAHVRRRDCLWSALGRLIAAAYWFHPLAWLALREMRREAERACDDRAVLSGISPADYADTLVLIAKTTLSAPATAVPMTGRSPLEVRLRAILGSAINRRSANLIGVSLLILALVVPLAALRQESHRIDEPGISAPKLIATLRQEPYRIDEPGISAPKLIATLRQEPYRIDEPGVSAPKLISKVEPEYTPDARAARIEGTVVISGVVGSSGGVEEASVTRGVDPGLDANAVSAVRQWQFEPGTRNGKPVAVRVIIEVTFHVM